MATGSTRPGGRRTRLWVVVACVAVAAAACGSSGSSKTGNRPATTGGASGSPGGSTAQGTPLNVMTIASVNYAGPAYPNILETAKVAGDWINAHGGIKGHPVDVTTCDEQGDPTKTAQCGRSAIAHHDVALVGSFSLNGSAIIPELQAANTSWFGICCASSTDEDTSPVSQPIGGGQVLNVAVGVKMAIDGCKKPGLIVYNDPAVVATTQRVLQAGLTSVNGPPLAKTVTIPLTAEDYSSEVAQLKGTDCIYGNMSPSEWSSFMPPFVSQGMHQRLYGPQGNLDPTITKAFPKATENAVVFGVYSDISLPVWSDYRAALKQYNAPTNLDYNSLAGLGTWAAYVAFEQICDSIRGPINNQTFLAAAQKATVNLHGMAGVGGIDFAKPFTALGPNYRNTFNRAVTLDVVHNGQLVPFDNGKFFDMSVAVTGKPLPASDRPPAGQQG